MQKYGQNVVKKESKMGKKERKIRKTRVFHDRQIKNE
jgi:hypothetical protein